ncbi:ABC transporter ATP-binding protein [Sporomusa malonica]|uniref:ATP-binding cassette, subfamily B n=1 Tax=Sporomusa malonica TaxID=112901 RepID=A0A1W2DF22_9FIRM|nr:ABC transporter ATP-binding protein [Sporomusa malonica]SMC96130.1 ATP-binding cassette, subfamily B [Sporomusa malonica]
MADQNRQENPKQSAYSGSFRGGKRLGWGKRGTVVKPQNFWKTMGRLWGYLSQEKGQLALIFCLVLLEAALALLGPYLIGVAVDAVAAYGRGEFPGRLEQVLYLLLAVYTGTAVLAAGQGWLIVGVSQRLVTGLRQELFAKLQKVPLVYLDTQGHGEVMSRFTNDIDQVSMTVSHSSSQLMGGSIAIIGSLVMMLSLSPLLTLAAMVTVPLVILLTRVISQQTGQLFKEQLAELGRLNAHAEETISGIEVIKAYNHEPKAIAEFNQVNDRLCQVGLKAQIWSGFLMPIMNVINNVGFAAIAIGGGILAVYQGITVGIIASFLGYSRQFVRPLNDLGNTFNMLQSGVAGAERVLELLDIGEEPPDPPQAVVLNKPRGQVRFEKVTFGYRPDQPILHEISFVAEAGSSVALIGPTGAGKTTIVNLLTRFYDVTGGAITIDGRDIREYTRDSVRNCFGIVLQDTYLFSGTIRDNIRYGRPEASDQEVVAAAAKANAAGFIERFPQGYDTVLMENGSNLSQGQKQLLAIARVILADPSILVLDEATSSIDTRTEGHIQAALQTIMQGRTTFIIAHRLNTIRDVDMVLEIQNGRIVRGA